MIKYIQMLIYPPEGTECEKRLVKKFTSANSLSAR